MSNAKHSKEQSQASLPEALIDHIRRPRNLGPVANPDGVGTATRGCGDTIEISLRVREGRIEQAGFTVRGCPWSLACASAATTLLEDQPLLDARNRVDDETILTILGGLPAGEEHCATLASKAAAQAILDAFRTAREPWKKAYR